MTPCLAPDELVDLVDGTLPAARAAHLGSCVACRLAAEALRDTSVEVHAADVPEPSPFFWDSLNRRVRTAIVETPPVRAGWAGWLSWDTVMPLAGMAVVLTALGAAIARPPLVENGASGAPSIAAIDPAVEIPEMTDDALALVVDLAGMLEPGDALPLAPLPDLGDVAAVTLTSDELHALEQLLREAVDQAQIMTPTLSIRVGLAAAMTLALTGAAAAQAPPADAADLRPAEIQRLFDAYLVMEAQQTLGLSDTQYPTFLTRLRALQDTRRRHLQARAQLLQELGRMTAPRATADDALIRERLAALQELESRGAAESRKAYTDLDALLDPRQQARFRVFEEQIERRKLELMLRARQNARAGQRPLRQFRQQ